VVTSESGSRRIHPGAYAIVADDDDELRGLVASVLRGLALHVVEARNGRELLELFRVRGCAAPALIVTDLQMPELTGLQALRRLRRIGIPSPVILVTAFGDPRIMKEALRAGAVSVLDKPFSIAVLRELASRLLGTTPAERGSAVRSMPALGEALKKGMKAG
jgi:two-component system, OmpR family, response regulator